jgi:pimeloyl-ACP methyl ester carboxylesterase
MLTTCKEEILEVRLGRRINIFTYTPSTAKDITTLFFLPGSLACHQIDNKLMTYFIEKYPRTVQVVAYDAYGLIFLNHDFPPHTYSRNTLQVGSGKSERPRDWDEYGNVIGHYSTENLFLDTLEILQRYGTDRNVLIGHSFGSTQIARVHHKAKGLINVSSVVLLGTAFSMPDGAHPGKQTTKHYSGCCT